MHFHDDPEMPPLGINPEDFLPTVHTHTTIYCEQTWIPYMGEGWMKFLVPTVKYQKL